MGDVRLWCWSEWQGSGEGQGWVDNVKSPIPHSMVAPAGLKAGDSRLQAAAGATAIQLVNVSAELMAAGHRLFAACVGSMQSWWVGELCIACNFVTVTPSLPCTCRLL
jgi:hypothetical protein